MHASAILECTCQRYDSQPLHATERLVAVYLQAYRPGAIPSPLVLELQIGWL